MDYISFLKETNEGLKRLDFCLTCWDHRQKESESLDANWKSFIPEKQKEGIKEQFQFLLTNINLLLEQKKYKEAFIEISNLLKSNKYTEIQLHQEFYTLVTNFELNNKEFFEYAYQILISKPKGPKLAKFVLDLKTKAITLFSSL